MNIRSYDFGRKIKTLPSAKSASFLFTNHSLDSGNLFSCASSSSVVGFRTERKKTVLLYTCYVMFNCHSICLILERKNRKLLERMSILWHTLKVVCFYVIEMQASFPLMKPLKIGKRANFWKYFWLHFSQVDWVNI